MFIYAADELSTDITEITSVGFYVTHFSSTTAPTTNVNLHVLVYESPNHKIQHIPNRFPPPPIGGVNVSPHG